MKSPFSTRFAQIIGALFSPHIAKKFLEPVSVKQSGSLFENVLSSDGCLSSSIFL